MGIRLPSLTRPTRISVPLHEYRRLLHLRMRVENILDQDGLYRLALSDAEIINKLDLVVAKFGSNRAKR